MNKVGLDHLEGRMGFWMLIGIFIVMAPLFVIAEVMSWFERRK